MWVNKGNLLRNEKFKWLLLIKSNFRNSSRSELKIRITIRYSFNIKYRRSWNCWTWLLK